MWRPRSLRLRYTLRALLVFITLFMLWGGYHANRGWRERQAIAILRERFASIHDQHWPSYNPRWWYPRLVSSLWQDRHITTVSMNAELTDEEVEALVSLPSLDYLILDPALGSSNHIPTVEDFRPVPLPHGALRRILSTHKMRSLSLNRCILSEDDLRAIGDEGSLTYVCVGGPTVDDRPLRAILSIPRLDTLCVIGSPATGEGLANHPGSQTLTNFWSKETPLAEEFAAFLAKCPNLRAANLSDARATAAFTRHLENHANLEQLGLLRAGLTEPSIDSLLTIPHLTRLPLPARLLSPEVQARIKRQRPDIVIVPFND